MEEAKNKKFNPNISELKKLNTATKKIRNAIKMLKSASDDFIDIRLDELTPDGKIGHSYVMSSVGVRDGLSKVTHSLVSIRQVLESEFKNSMWLDVARKELQKKEKAPEKETPEEFDEKPVLAIEVDFLS